MTEYKLGEKLRGTGHMTGSRYEGTVVGTGSAYGPKIQITKNEDYPDTGSAPGRFAYIKNIERIEDMSYTKNLIGPKPEPVQEPKFVTPFRSVGRDVVDANDRVVFKVRNGGHKLGSFSQELPMDQAYDLAKVMAEALNEKFETKVKDAPSPF